MLYSWDPSRDRLVARASTVAQRDYEQAIELALGEGVVGWSALNRETVLIDDFPTDDLRFRVVPGIDEVTHRSFLAVPLMAQGSASGQPSDVQGVFVARHAEPRQFTLEDVQAIDAIGLLIATLLSDETTHSDDRLASALRRLGDIGATHDLSLAEVPTLIASELADASQVELIAIVAAASTGRPYLDIRGVGVSGQQDASPLTMQQVSADAVGAAIAANGPLRRDVTELLFEPFGARAATFTSVTAHRLEARGTSLGTVLAFQSESISGRDRASERLAALIQQAAVALALAELTAKPVNNAAERRLIDLLVSSESRPALVQQLARETGFDTSEVHCVVVGQASDSTDPGIVHQQLHSIERAIRREHPDALCDVIADSVRAIVRLVSRSPAEVAIGLDRRLGQLNIGHVGVSDGVVVGDYRRGLAEATTATQVSVRVPGMARAMAVSEAGAYRYLLTLVDHQQPTALERQLAQLRVDDEALFATVAAFVESGCRPSPTARALHLHRNSLTGRLNTARALLGIPIDESTRLVLELAINLVRLRPPTPSDLQLADRTGHR